MFDNLRVLEHDWLCAILIILVRQVQSLYYLGASGNGAKCTAAAGNAGSSGVDPSSLPPSAVGEEARGGGRKAGSRKSKRRKKGITADATEDVADKENEQPAGVDGAGAAGVAVTKSTAEVGQLPFHQLTCIATACIAC